MAATYTPVTRSEMEELLAPQGFELVRVAGTTELVYGKRVDTNGNMLTLRVYTGINPDGASRGVGEDAIRVVVMWRAFTAPPGKTSSRYAQGIPESFPIIKPVGKKEIRVHRTQNWRKSLQKRIDNWMERIDTPPCPECGCPTREKTTKVTKVVFYSCCRFPYCVGSTSEHHS